MNRQLLDKFNQSFKEGLENVISKGVNWERPFIGYGSVLNGKLPMSAQSGKPYTGFNILLLWFAQSGKGYTSNYWITKKEIMRIATEHDTFLSFKGQSPTMITFFNTQVIEDKETQKEKMISYRKPFFVWNCSQIEGLEKVRPDLFEEVEPLKQINNDTRIESVDNFFSNTGITLNHSGNTAFYNTKDDFVNMPDYELFPDNLSYYSVLSHEFIHSTGHKKRLDRFKAGRKAYSFEELVAEIGSCFLNAQFGLQMQPDQNQFAYCKHWLDGLNNDQTFIISASAKAQKAVDFLNTQQEMKQAVA